MKKINKLFSHFFVVFFLLIGMQGRVLADSNLAISVNAILPENQHNKDATYYDLRMKPGQKQTLDFELINPSEKDVTVQLELNDATTNDGGAIDYSSRGEDYQRDDSLRLSLTDLATIPDEVLVKAGSKETVKIKLEMPEEAFKGIIVGGIRVTQADEEEKTSKSANSSMEIKNKVAYTVGMTLSESDEEVDADLVFKKAFASQRNGYNVVKGRVQNTEPQVLEQLYYKAKVTKKGSTKVLHESTGENYRFAPNSYFDFDVNWENQSFKAGDYTYLMSVESKETGQTWDFETDFTITSAEAKKLNKEAIELEKNNLIWLIIIGTALGVIIVILSLIYIQMKKNKAATAKRNNKKKKPHTKSKKTKKK